MRFRRHGRLAYAEQIHAGQRRRVDNAPFIVHPLEVASLLLDAGAADRVIAAGILHDVIEKTDAEAADLRVRFGSSITRLVLAVSEDKRISGYATRKAALRDQAARAGREALMVLAADKISKVRELSLEQPAARRPRRRPLGGSRSRDRRVDHYRRCLLLLEEHLGDSPLVAQLRRELDAITGMGDGSDGRSLQPPLRARQSHLPRRSTQARGRRRDAASTDAARADARHPRRHRAEPD